MFMSMEEIIDNYEENWVYLINCENDEYGTIGGEVVLTAKTVSELFEGMKKYENEKSETMFFGIPSKYTVFLL